MDTLHTLRWNVVLKQFLQTLGLFSGKDECLSSSGDFNSHPDNFEVAYKGNRNHVASSVFVDTSHYFSPIFDCQRCEPIGNGLKRAL